LGLQAVIDLNPKAGEPVEDHLRRAITHKQFRIEAARRDHFEDKLIVRHDSGNCSAIFKGALAEADRDWLREAIRFPQGCTATKSVFIEDGPGWVETAAGILNELRTGDPLDIQTQVGYIDAATLDHLERLVRENRLRAGFIGGERLSPFQARPLLVAGQEPAQVFFTDEIPTYILAVQTCPDTSHAVDAINRYTRREPRLAVSLHHLTPAEQIEACTRIRAHTILVGRPTSDIVPIFHEGNDYTNQFQPGRIVVR
jgi:acyl-CoA reductase-like NAD-dependent aldehyde dehydrogenase